MNPEKAQQFIEKVSTMVVNMVKTDDGVGDFDGMGVTHIAMGGLFVFRMRVESDGVNVVLTKVNGEDFDEIDDEVSLKLDEYDVDLIKDVLERFKSEWCIE